jgi:hypothetical protein
MATQIKLGLESSNTHGTTAMLSIAVWPCRLVQPTRAETAWFEANAKHIRVYINYTREHVAYAPHSILAQIHLRMDRSVSAYTRVLKWSEFS